MCGLAGAIALFSGPSLAEGLKRGKEPKTNFSFFSRVAASSQCLKTTTTLALEASPQGSTAKARAGKKKEN